MKIGLLGLRRVAVIGVALIVQLALVVLVVLRFQNRFYLFYVASIALSLLALIWILNNATHPTFKIAWIIPILVLPVFGGLVYIYYGRTRLRSSMRRQLLRVAERARTALPNDAPQLQALEAQSPDSARLARYVSAYAGGPLYHNAEARYLPSGELFFEALLEALQSAERFIFIEFFIIQEGRMWNGILEVLREKAAAGVEVRVIYDDAGCLMKLPPDYHLQLEAAGIRCAVFNPIRPILSPMLNYRDHRKIVVVDGVVAFTGGANLADEYINHIEVFGHWKDSAVAVRGPAAWTLAVLFLQVWDYLRQTETDYAALRPAAHAYGLNAGATAGYVQPFGDSPLDDERVGENVYIGIIARARSYAYITTPYLIIDNELFAALTLAAKSGVDVRIITPHIPDKRFVHAVTRSYYRALIAGGVRVYEYTPGFMHSKSCVADDAVGVVGTINMDYRSLFLHFECGVCLYRNDAVHAMRQDFERTLATCHEITNADLDTAGLVARSTRVVGRVLRVFSPLL